MCVIPRFREGDVSAARGRGDEVAPLPADSGDGVEHGELVIAEGDGRRGEVLFEV